MSVTLKTPEEIEKMRVAGRLAAEVLDFIAPVRQAGLTTGEIDRLCHEYMVDEQGTIPAPLNYAPAGLPAVSQIDLHLGQPRRVPWRSRATRCSSPATSSTSTSP